MNELIKVNVSENEEQTVSGRELHAFLEVESRYNDWFARMLKYDFVEGTDYILKNEYIHSDKREREYTQTDHILKLDMAKELCMIARNEKGKQARQYFLQVERDWNSPEKVMARALRIAEKSLSEYKCLCEAQAQQIEEFKPIKNYYETILESKDTLVVSQIAADYGISAIKLNKILHEEKLIYNSNGQWLAYQKVRENNYTASRTCTFTHKDGSVGSKTYTVWTQKGRLKIHEILNRRGIKANIDK